MSVAQRLPVSARPLTTRRVSSSPPAAASPPRPRSPTSMPCWIRCGRWGGRFCRRSSVSELYASAGGSLRSLKAALSDYLQLTDRKGREPYESQPEGAAAPYRTEEEGRPAPRCLHRWDDERRHRRRDDPLRSYPARGALQERADGRHLHRRA